MSSTNQIIAKELTVDEQIEKYGSRRLRRVSVLNYYYGEIKHHKSYNNGYVTYTYKNTGVVVYVDKDMYMSDICKKKIQDILTFFHDESCDCEFDILYEYSTPYCYNSFLTTLVCKIINYCSDYIYALPTYFVCSESEALWDGDLKSIETLICRTAIEIFNSSKDIKNEAKQLCKNKISYPIEEDTKEPLLSIKQQRIKDNIAEFKIVKDLDWNNEDGSIRYYFSMKGKCTLQKFMWWRFAEGIAFENEGVIIAHDGMSNHYSYIHDGEVYWEWSNDIDNRAIENIELIIQKDGKTVYNIYLVDNFDYDKYKF